MSMPFSLTGIHLRDGTHAGPAFLAQVLNVYLNLYKQHLLETGQRPLPEPSSESRLQIFLLLQFQSPFLQDCRQLLVRESKAQETSLAVPPQQQM